MKPQATAQKFFALAGTGFLLTLTTVILGSPFVRVLFKAYKSVYFWLFGLVVTAGFAAMKAPILSIFLGSVWILVGVYGEIEKRGRGWKVAGFTSLLASILFMLGGMVYVLWIYDINTWDRYVLFVSEISQNLQRYNPALKIDATFLAQQTPSILGSLLVLALGNALIFEKRAARLFKVSTEKVASQLRLLEFRLPDSVIWAFLLAFLFSMVNFDMPWLSVVGINLVNIAVILFFFQGLAVMEVFFVVMKTSLFFRVLTYIILVGYLFVIISGVGLIDYWVDFRSRLRRLQAAEMN